ncbi:MAG: glutamine synthetase III [Deltaproteobacteria bacterium]|jgi:glutamine synthetase|nr:glutamine synthetase III [Deltaproteobacteria bacterium]
MPYTPRQRVRAAIAEEKITNNAKAPKVEPYVPAHVFGKDVFTMKIMRERLPKNVYQRIEKIYERGESLQDSDADIVASAMKDWAIEHGATHYTHWFQPMTGFTAEKHDAFLTPLPGQRGEAQLITEFSGKMLIKGEPDASSFPSGGIRSTFEARGYTAWDPTSPAFLLGSGMGRTLYVPSLFLSYTGESLDRKTPLLRSLDAVSKQALRVLRLFGNTSARYVDVMVGAEQEYFLVDRRYASLREDLKLARRTLFGARPSKGQEMDDHYFGTIGSRVIAYMEEVEKRLYQLGIPARTRHNEAAPSQFELAPMYEKANVATDHNMLTMELLRTTARRHGFHCLLHEKPFAYINGSGKHNNWSLCDSDGNNLFEPGATPMDNAQFLVFLAAVLRAVHMHPVVMRLSTASAGNDHRLGASEAPPAILSIFLGDQLTDIIDNIAEGKNGKESGGWKSKAMKIGVSALPTLPRDISDRNRTSPFAFTGNKFEFRAVGGSMSIAPANISFCTAMSCALEDIAVGLEASLAEGKTLEASVQSLLAQLFKEHRPIIFNGNGYSEAWKLEAAERGLPNLDSVEALAHYSDENVKDAFIRHSILNERELMARQEILLDGYIRDIHVETKVMLHIGRTVILPPCMKWMREASSIAAASRSMLGQTKEKLPEENYFHKVREHVVGLMESLDKLHAKHEELDCRSGTLERARGARDELVPLMEECRRHADTLETIVDDAIWPLPKYNELLWRR